MPMAKIIYGLSGEGSGHSSRSREMITHLQNQGHIVKVASYDRGYRNLKDDFDVMEIVGLRFVNENNRISKSKTLSENLELLPEGIESNNRLKQSLFKDFQPDAVITDFEPMTAYLANYFKIPLITIDNQHRMRYLDFNYPLEMKAEAIFIENLIRAIVPRPCVSLITSFYGGKLKNERSFIFPPILRKSVIDKQPRQEDHILVYATQSFDDLPEVLQQYKREHFKIYGFDKEGEEGSLEYRPFSRDGFLDDLASCKGVIATAGFTLMTEAFYLGKPYLAFPVHGQFEQEVNALMLKQEGYGNSGSEVNMALISAFLYDLPDYAAKLENYEREGNNKILTQLDKLFANNMELLLEFHHKRNK